ncbi:glycine cleavage system protein GcvH [Paenibacillus athensensis]|uniref:Glycine cleavage system H protein n=1 Tax=Paenibacillus athensensis TaxID=1967502 RepID=A0A4Y8PXV2_9BACL|nr:glycine cleavage system protein GcvH [Paenibacillus athensensis]MCD1259382.1 glycine cleavage system protein GcvH [Paenibacillus athensensis]
MSDVHSELLYTREHEWVQKLSDTLVRVGITDHAQDLLGDIVFVELPQQGVSLQASDPAGSMESVKTVSDIFSPVSGVVSAVNSTLEGAPEQINRSPYGEGWMFELTIAGPRSLEGLLSAEEYKALVDYD